MNRTGTKEGSSVYVVLQRIILVHITTAESILFYKESYYYKQRLQGLFCSTKNKTGTNRDFMFYVVLQRIILVQMKAPVLRLFYTESYWYKWRLQYLCYSTQYHTGTNGGSSAQVILHRIILVQMKDPSVLCGSTKYHTTFNPNQYDGLVAISKIISPVFSGVHVARSFVFCIVFCLWFYKDSCWYNQRFQGLFCSTKTIAGTNRDSRTVQFYKEAYWYKQRLHNYVVLQRSILVQIETPELCSSTMNHSLTNRDSRVQVILQRIILVQMKAPVSIWFQCLSPIRLYKL